LSWEIKDIMLPNIPIERNDNCKNYTNSRRFGNGTKRVMKINPASL
jgi:hypothetical protein